jgi:predicted flap endonuclease-1-like 5' DNA nuclease
MFEQNVTYGPGTGTFIQHSFEILLMLLGAAMLGLWLGWILWNRYKQEAEKLRLDLVGATAANDAQRTEIGALKTKLADFDTEHQNFSAQIASLTRNNNYQRDRITELEENLTVVQARNRQLETELGLTYEPETTDTYEFASTPVAPVETTTSVDEEPEGVVTVAEIPAEIPDIPLEINTLGETSADDTPVEEEAEEAATEEVVEADSEIIVAENAAVPELEIVTPVVTETIVTGEDTEGQSKPLPSDASLLVAGASSHKDDLTVIEGIGPKIQELLYQYGIRTYRQLATTDVTEVKDILRKAGPQLAMHDPGTWTAQALLAANDQWENLKAYQDYLSAGKAPKK